MSSSSSSRAKFWAFVSDNVVALSTVVAGVTVIIWQAVAAPTNLNPVSAAILGLLCLLATSEIIESRKRLDRIQETIDEEMSKVLAALPAAEIRRFLDSESGLTYLCKRLESSKTRIDFASIDTSSTTTASRARERLLKTRVNLAASGEIRFRYLFSAYGGRIARVKDMLRRADPGKFFTAGFPRGASTIPLIPFVVLDNEEVYTRSPYEVGEEEVYVSIKHPEVVGLFSQWFDRLWASSVKIDPRMSYEQQTTELDRLLHAED